MNRIREVRMAKGLTQQQLADELGLNVAQVSRMERGQVAINLDRLDRLADILKVDIAELMRAPSSDESGGDGPKVNDDAKVGNGPKPANDVDAPPPTNALPVRMEGASSVRLQENLPVFGTALGAPRVVDGETIEQTHLNTGEVVQYIKRPTILEGRGDTYGLYVQGHSMEPVHLAGDLVLVESRRPARIGDDVVVYLRPNGEDDDGDRARGVLIKRLMRRTASFVELEQYNPPQTFRMAADSVLRIDRVMRLADLIS